MHVRPIGGCLCRVDAEPIGDSQAKSPRDRHFEMMRIDRVKSKHGRRHWRQRRRRRRRVAWSMLGARLRKAAVHGFVRSFTNVAVATALPTVGKFLRAHARRKLQRGIPLLGARERRRRCGRGVWAGAHAFPVYCAVRNARKSIEVDYGTRQVQAIATLFCSRMIPQVASGRAGQSLDSSPVVVAIFRIEHRVYPRACCPAALTAQLDAAARGARETSDQHVLIRAFTAVPNQPPRRR